MKNFDNMCAFIPLFPVMNLSRRKSVSLRSWKASSFVSSRLLMPNECMHISCFRMKTDLDNVTDNQTNQTTNESDSPVDTPKSTRFFRLGIGIIYAAYVVYIFQLGSVSDMESSDLVVPTILAGHWDDINTLFFSIFSIVASSALNIAALLNPAASQQKRIFPTEVFVTFGLFLGITALGPYLIGREYAPKVSADEVAKRGFFSRILESKWLGISSLLYSLYCYALAFGIFVPGDLNFHNIVFYAAAVDLSRLYQADWTAVATCLDFLILNILIWGPLTEDMKRRGWFTQGREVESTLTAISFVLLPAIGPALYLTTRPPLPSSKANK